MFCKFLHFHKTKHLGLRIDNLHGTPVHVAEAMLDAARLVNPNIIIVAELFTGAKRFKSFFKKKKILELNFNENSKEMKTKMLNYVVD